MFMLFILYTNYVFLKTIPELLSMLSNTQLISLMCFAIVAGMFIMDEIDYEKPQSKEEDSSGTLPEENNTVHSAPLKNELTMTKLYMNAKTKEEIKDQE